MGQAQSRLQIPPQRKLLDRRQATVLSASPTPGLGASRLQVSLDRCQSTEFAAENADASASRKQGAAGYSATSRTTRKPSVERR